MKLYVCERGHNFALSVAAPFDESVGSYVGELDRERAASGESATSLDSGESPGPLARFDPDHRHNGECVRPDSRRVVMIPSARAVFGQAMPR